MKSNPAFRARIVVPFVAWLAAFGGGRLPAQELVLSEYVAANQSGLQDEDGDRPDWVEIQNLGANPVDLNGWFLTDDPDLLEKWPFPPRILESGDTLVVFASGKNRAGAAGELHTSFSLEQNGEYLGLVNPAGTVVDQYPEPFLPQFPDVSYGIAQTATVSVLLPEKAVAAMLVPAGGSAGLDWTLPAFDDSSWARGPAPVGFDRDGGEVVPPGGAKNLALAGTATQSSTDFGGEASRGIDGNTDPTWGGGSITHTNNDAGGWWEVDLGESFFIDRIVLWNRIDCCSHRLTNFRVSVLDEDRDPVAESDHFTRRNFPATQSYAIQLRGKTRGRFVRVWKLGPDKDGEYYLSLAEVQVFEATAGFQSLLGTDIEGTMFGAGSSLYLRVPFELSAADLGDLQILTLRVKYDDGFVAYLNGTLVASRNAPAAPIWSSTANAERSDANAVTFEDVNISQARGSLRAGTNVLAVHALNLAANDSDLLFAAELTARRVGVTKRLYFQRPTPGAINDTAGVDGFAGEPIFSHDRGYYYDPFEIELDSSTPGAVIRYTLDGSVPTLTHGSTYEQPVPIERTTRVRAAAFKAELVASKVTTHTYIFLDDVIASSVMNKSITRDARYAPKLEDALLDLPAISLVTPATINDSTEVPVSMELLLPDGTPGFQIDAGVQYYGGAFTAFNKKNFRFYFRREYGSAKLNYPLFRGFDRGIRSVEEFDHLELRSGSHDMNERGFYMSNSFTDDTMLDMGNLNPHSQYVHVYLNGTYWGMYHMRERWSASMLSEYLGGEKEDYEAINGNWNVGGWPDPGVPYDGDGTAWERIKSLRNDYEAVKPYLDVPHYVDYMIMFMFGDSEDEYRCVGPTAPGSGFKFFLNDADGFLRDGGSKTAMGKPGRLPGDGPGSIFSMLLVEGHPDYLTLLGDRIHKHFFNDGAMTPAKNTERLLERCNQVALAFILESARWGYRTPSSWESAKNSYVSGVLPGRTATVIGQYRAAGFYPKVDAPKFQRHGGVVEAGFRVLITAPRGAIYYTIDGTDPRLPGGEVSPAANEGGSVESPLISPGVTSKLLVPTDGALALGWTATDFDDSAWTSARTGIGYERETGYEALIVTDVEEAMYGVGSSVYFRIPFTANDTDMSLALDMQYDDGYIAYLNGVQVASKNAPATPTWSSVAARSHPDAAAMQFERVDLTTDAKLLPAGRNVLAIHGLNASSTNGDLLFVPKLMALKPIDAGNANVLTRSTVVKARSFLNDAWSALNEATFLVDSGSLRVTEIMYHPPRDAVPGQFDREDYEFIELQNTGTRPINLLGLRFTEGLSFDFPGNEDPAADLAPGETVVVVKNLAAFTSRYGTQGVTIAGEYTRNLSNGGDRIVLGDIFGNTLLDFTYSDKWYPQSDGAGRSMEIVDSLADPALWSSPANWHAGEDLGTPGFHTFGTGGLQRPGDLNQDATLDIADPIAILFHLFLGAAALPCGSTLEDGGNLALLDVDSSGNVAVTDVVFLLDHLFRTGPAPALGSHCARIPGCPDRCGGR